MFVAYSMSSVFVIDPPDARSYTFVEFVTYSSAITSHVYWFAIAFAAMFTQRELYLCIISLLYFTETVLWACVHIGMHHGQFPLETGYPPRVITILTEDFTLEVQLCACFMGILIFHVLYYNKGAAHVGAHSTVLSFGVLAPAVLVVVGVSSDFAPLHRYALYYALGFASGMWRGGVTAMLFSRRLTLINSVLRNPTVCWFSNIHDSILGPLMAPDPPPLPAQPQETVHHRQQQHTSPYSVSKKRIQLSTLARFPAQAQTV